MSREKVLVTMEYALNGFELLVRIFSLKCSTSGGTGKTGVSMFNCSGVDFSGKFEQLESPSSLSDLRQSIFRGKVFYFFLSVHHTVFA